MRLVETVGGKLLDQVEDLTRQLGIHLRRHRCSLDEQLSLFLHECRILLSHGPPHQVGLCKRETGQLLHQLHDLFLIHNDAVGRMQNRLHLWMEVGDLPATVLPLDDVRDVVHGARTVQGVHSNKVVQPLRF